MATPMWCIRAGRAGEADSLFLKENRIALGWDEMGDLSSLTSREEFRKRAGSVYSNEKPKAAQVWADQLYNFVRVMKNDDYFIYPSKIDRRIHIGKILDNYTHNSSSMSQFPHRRNVLWIKSVPRTSFSEGALYEIGSAISIFQVREHVDEFWNTLKIQVEQPTLSIVTTIESSIHNADSIEELTRDFILKALAQYTKGHLFAEFVSNLLETLGYKCRVSPPGDDGGIDIVAHPDELGFEQPLVLVQVKSGSGSISADTIRSLNSLAQKNSAYGLFVTLGDFTSPARKEFRNDTRMRLIDGKELVDLIFDHYESLKPEFKALFPMRRVFVPERQVEEE